MAIALPRGIDRNFLDTFLKELVNNGLLTGFGFDEKGDLVLHWALQLSSAQRSESLAALLGPLAAVEPSEVIPSLNLFEGEVRPGSGFLRVEGDRPAGPHGCLGVLLTSSTGESEKYFLTAGHLVSSDWSDGVGASIHRSGVGITGTERARRLGKVSKISPVSPSPRWNSLDAALIHCQEDVAVEEKPTCFDKFGPDADSLYGEVMKCGTQEPTFTGGKIELRGYCCALSRAGKKYLFENQIFVTSGRFGRPFAKPGDSGCMVAIAQNKGNYLKLVGMIIGGSVLKDAFVITPTKSLQTFWKAEKLEQKLSSGSGQPFALSRQAAVPAVAPRFLDQEVAPRRHRKL